MEIVAVDELSFHPHAIVGAKAAISINTRCRGIESQSAGDRAAIVRSCLKDAALLPVTVVASQVVDPRLIAASKGKFEENGGITVPLS